MIYAYLYLFILILYIIAIYHIFRRKKKTVEYWTYDAKLYPDLNENFKFDSSCFDIKSVEESVFIECGKTHTFKTGLYFNLPRGYELQIRPRSGLSKQMIIVAFGTVDSDYRGEIGITVYNLSDKAFEIKRGDRIAQGHISKMDFCPSNGDSFKKLKSKDELDKTLRGESGFGSTGI